MSVKKIGGNIYLVDLETGGIRNFIASYVLTGESVAIIEIGPASSTQNLLQGLDELSIKPDEVTYVAVTHVHIDHGGGVGKLLKILPKAKVIVHHRGAFHLANPEKLWQQSKIAMGKMAEIYGRPEPVPMERIIAAADGMTFTVDDDLTLRVLENPGHAPHHLCYYEPLSGGVFIGDAAGTYISAIDVVVPLTPPPFRLDVTLASLERLTVLKPELLYYTHFGEARNALENIKTYMRKLKLWAKVIREAINEGESFEAAKERIFENDEEARRAEEYLKLYGGVVGETVLNESIEGFIEFIKESRVPF